MTEAAAVQLAADLHALKSELEDDLRLCTTRDQHIRMSVRLSHLSSLIQKLTAESA